MSLPAARSRLVAASVAGGALLFPDVAGAHGIAQRADLPIPEWLFAWAAALVLVASFVGLAVLWPRPRLASAPERRLFSVPRVLEPLAGALGVALFVLVVYSGMAGSQTATANLAPTAVFVIFWVGIPFASAVFGDVFSAINPWRAIGRACGHLATRFGGRPLPAPLSYPDRVGRWPAAAGIMAFAWFELISTSRSDPGTLAILALVYAAIMLVGMALYGVETWTRNADAFAVTFGLYALLAPLRWSHRTVYLRAPLTGAPGMPTVAGSVALLCTMIGTTTFDGFTQGSAWTGVGGLSERLASVFEDLGLNGLTAVEAGSTVGLVVVVLIVAGLYQAGIAGMRSVGRDHSQQDLTRAFAHTLIPISLAYVAAHYFSLLLFQGQAMAFLISDPLGQGSDIFGTATRTIDYGVISPNGIWYAQVLALIAGHVAGLILAHDRALTLWSEPRVATRSQYWMLAVMVTFTCLGLWLLSAAAQ